MAKNKRNGKMVTIIYGCKLPTPTKSTSFVATYTPNQREIEIEKKYTEGGGGGKHYDLIYLKIG